MMEDVFFLPSCLAFLEDVEFLLFQCFQILGKIPDMVICLGELYLG